MLDDGSRRQDDERLAGYRVINDVSSIHSPFPALYPTRANDPPPGSDWFGVGMGIFYSFGVGLSR